MNNIKSIEMSRLQDDLMQVICDVTPCVSVGITIYDESQAKIALVKNNYTRDIINALIAKGYAVLGVYSNPHVDYIRVSRPLYRIELIMDEPEHREVYFVGPHKNALIDMAQNEARGKILDISNSISLDNGRTWDLVGPFFPKNMESRSFLRVSLGVSSFRISFDLNVL